MPELNNFMDANAVMFGDGDCCLFCADGWGSMDGTGTGNGNTFEFQIIPLTTFVCALYLM